METYFATPERDSKENLLKDLNLLNSSNELKLFLDSVSELVIVLNKYRQIVYANKVFLNFVEADRVEDVIGFRPGEGINCIHADELEGGCGTSESCVECGAVKAIIKTLKTNKQGGEEVRIVQHGGEALDLMIKTTPFVLNDSEYVIAAFSDISSIKRRRILEKIFFHDVLNTAGALSNFMELLDDSTPEEKEELLKLSKLLSSELVEEIESQKNLMAIETGEYELEIEDVNVKQLLEVLEYTFKNNTHFLNKKIKLDPCDELVIKTDRTLLRRVLYNLLKNALEAISPGEEVSFGILNSQAESLTFFVQNPGVIPKNIRLQIFQRSFSTKGIGRGLGTYNVKLLTEKFLKGKVHFESSPETQTIFYLKIPLEMKQKVLA
ncbi:MAG: ATP-binding protein [Melioribacteraceae bacterium]|nr:ATP-binding protein [Melioribacteraceae bacterium]